MLVVLQGIVQETKESAIREMPSNVATNDGGSEKEYEEPATKRKKTKESATREMPSNVATDVGGSERECEEPATKRKKWGD